MAVGAPCLTKRERMVSRKLIETLFGGSRSLTAFPIRVVYMKRERTRYDAPAQVLISVSKRRFKHAVDRNRVKRQLREAFRQNKQMLYDVLAEDEQLLMAVIWLSDEHCPSCMVETRMVALMQRMREKLG